MGSTDLPCTGCDQPTETEKLVRLFGSPEFHSTPRSRAFLRFIVSHAAPASILIEEFRDGAGSQRRSTVVDGPRDAIIAQLAKFRDIAVIVGWVRDPEIWLVLGDNDATTI